MNLLHERLLGMWNESVFSPLENKPNYVALHRHGSQ